MATGIRDKVAVLGMGCARFGERFDANADDLMVEAFDECLEDAGIDVSQIEAAWGATTFDEMGVGKSAIPYSQALRLPNIPVSRVENYCASGSESFRAAAYAVASGACDIALAVGVEKLKDTGFGGLPNMNPGPVASQWWCNITAPGGFAQLASAYRAKHGLDQSDLKRAMAHVSVKSHANGALNDKAHLRRPITEEQALDAPIIAEPLGLYDCCGVSDGAACAILTTPEIAKSLNKDPIVTIKALQIAASNGSEAHFNGWDGSHFHTTRIASRRAYEEAGIRNPRDELSLIEVHDCFSVTELVTMEDLHISEEGRASTDIMDGFYDADGDVPCQIDGGLKCFGHPIGASGIRMLYEMYLQLQGRAGERQRDNVDLCLTHNLGGFPHENVAAVCIVGRGN